MIVLELGTLAGCGVYWRRWSRVMHKYAPRCIGREIDAGRVKWWLRGRLMLVVAAP